ncbi:MAG: hypothetical protein RLY43_385 [Bacteroidota bacterium]|jgi:hypothetical protein
MSIIIKKLTIKNFISVGAVTQAVDLTAENLTLVLGENLDMGGEHTGNKNGVGKCCGINTKIKIRNTESGKIYETTIGELYDGAAKFNRKK